MYLGDFVMRLKRSLAGLAILALAAVGMPNKAMAIAVDLELQLLVDVSASISTAEFNTQRDGYEAAFRDAGIISAIENGTLGTIAVQLVYWSTGQAVGVGWTQISDSTTANAFADAIAAAARPFSANTGPGSAINFGAPLFANNGFEGTRLVMDVSGDGVQNTGDDTSDARDAALLAGIDTINGLTIGTSQTLEDFYMDNIVAGGGFLVTAATFGDFADAVLEKIGREINGEIPIPGAIPLMLTGIGLLWANSRRRRKAA